MSDDHDLSEDLEAASSDGKRLIALDMPTGTGKHRLLARQAAKATGASRMIFISGHPALTKAAIDTIREASPRLEVSDDINSSADVVVISIQKAARATRDKPLPSGFTTLWMGERHDVHDSIARRVAAPFVADPTVRIVDEAGAGHRVFDTPDAEIGYGMSDIAAFRQAFCFPGPVEA